MKFSKEKNLKKQLKNNSAITLIALVITIIVLLILAGVSLSMIFSQNGIFNRAEQSATEHRAATVEDEVSIWKNEKNLAQYDQGMTTTRDEIIESQKSRGLLTDDEAKIAKAMGNVKIGTKTINYGTESNIRLTTKQTPIIIEGEVVAVDIEIIVEGIEEKKFSFEEVYSGIDAREFVKYSKEIIKKMDEQEKNKLIETALVYGKYCSDTKHTYTATIQGLCEYLGISSLNEIDLYSLPEGINYLFDFATCPECENLEESILLTGFLNSYSPYTNIDTDTMDILIKQYILKCTEGLRNDRNHFITTKNGEFEFVAKVLDTGEEIKTIVNVTTEIHEKVGNTESLEYEVGYYDNCLTLRIKNVPEGVSSFGKAYAVYKGIDYELSREESQIREYTRHGKLFDYICNLYPSEIEETGMVDVIICIEKENTLYFIYTKALNVEPQ